MVRSLVSAISAGTEQLIYRGHVADDMPLDETIADLAGNFTYPFKYGYAVVGQVIAIGAGVAPEWRDRLIFAFHPHESHFITTPDTVFPLPTDIDPDDAVFLPNMETAVNFVMDGHPLLGERVAVLGQGVVGLLTTALLARYPLEGLLTVEPYSLRREASLALGAQSSVKPSELPNFLKQSQPSQPNGFDLIYELSGNPAALRQAIDLAGFDSRIIIGSWYGTKPVNLDLGGKFHRQRIRLISSQVSTLAPNIRGRWTKSRRIALAWQMLQKIRPAHLISHRFHMSQAAQAYDLLKETPEEAIQVVLSY